MEYIATANNKTLFTPISTHVDLRIVLFLTLLIVNFSVFSAEPLIRVKLLSANSDNMQQIKRGKMIYKRFCSLCHGNNLQGQPNWRTRKPNGKLPAPPHDETGHTWHHADQLLFNIIKYGLVPPYGPENYQSDMPAWESTLKDRDIWAVLEYIKSRWPAETRKIQADVNRDSLK